MIIFLTMSTEKKIQKFSKLQITLGTIALILVIGVGAVVAGYYPVALVGNNLISHKEFENRISLAKKLEPNADSSQVYDQMIINAKKEQMVGKVDVNSELNYYKTGREQEYKNFLNQYFSGNEKEFVKFIVLPKIYDAILSRKYNSDFGLNNDAYNKADNVIRRLNNGETFEDLAKIYSDDKVSGQLGGDLGFVIKGQLLPELEDAVKSATLGEVEKKIIVTRLGYHILFPVETAQKDGQKVWHIKHILITTAGYDGWLQKQLDAISVKRLFN